MRLATILSLGASALLGVGALVVARVWLPGADGDKAEVKTVPVVAAAKDIAYGTKIDPKLLTILRLPADAVPLGAYASIDQVVKLDGGSPVALMPISAREALLPAKLSGAATRASLAALISPGMRAYTIKVNETAGVGGHALPGDHVDVLLAREPKDGGPVTVDVVLQNVRLLGMNLNADPTSTDKATPKTTTLEVTVEDAGRLSVASKVGTLSLALRRVGSAEVETVGPINISDLRIGASEPPPSAPRAAVRRPAPARVAATPSGGLVIVNGTTRSSVGAGA